MKYHFAVLIFLFSHWQLKAQATSDILPDKEVDSLISGYIKVLNETYFNKELGQEISATLQRKLAAGDFYNKGQLTDRLSLLLRELTNDIHFYVGINKSEDTQPAHSDESQKDDTGGSYGGISEVRIIHSKIGYIKITDFIANDDSFQKVIAALQFVRGVQYLILDLSECAGGDGRMGGFINHHLFEDNDYQNLLRKKCTGETEWHQSEVPYNFSTGPKFYDIPVFVMTSGKTSSAAEYFSWIIQEMKRGVVLGDTTAGAGNPVVSVTFGHYFAYIPICEIETRDGKSIEGKGVTPDIKLVSSNLLQETILYIQNNFH